MSKTEWKEYEMSELIEEISMGPFGSNIKVECFTDSGVPVLNGSNLVGFRLNEDSFNYVTEEKATSLGKANAYRGDIVITHRGTLGQIVYIPQNSKYSRYVISQSQFRVRCNEKVIPEYLVYYFHSRLGQHKLLSNASQVGVPSLARPTSTFQKLTISIPPVAKQKEIVKILSSLDDKIELNNAINRNLEEQAQAIFKSWFVDFESFGGKIPEDWKLGKLGDVAEIKKKAFHPEKNPGLIVEHYSLPALDEKHYPVFEVADGIKSNKFVVSKESVLISKLNPETKRIWRPYCISENPICSTEFVVFESINGSHRDFLYSIIDSQQFYDFMGSLVTGCTNSHQRVSPETLLTFPIAIPPKTILKSFCDKITPIYEMIEKNVLENQRLANLRDSTLPKLMSGEIDSDKIAV